MSDQERDIRDIGRTPAVRAVIDHIIAITGIAKAAFPGEQAGDTWKR
jgi:hypothetical protein